MRIVFYFLYFHSPLKLSLQVCDLIRARPSMLLQLANFFLEIGAPI